MEPRCGAGFSSDGPAGNGAIQDLVALFSRYFQGLRTDFGRVRIAEEGLSRFQTDIIRAARTIPYGTTVSYGRLAALAGNPTAVRAAASVMRHNPFAIVVPCHRVIRADGKPGGFMGAVTGEKAALKRRLLQLERAKR
jgi:methylated-DNA-[protein]-cysteine S-methyltransferase